MTKKIAQKISEIILQCAHASRFGVSFILQRPTMLNGVRIIVEQNNSFLCVRHTYAAGVWTLPGGGIRKDESTVDAALRELKEETGLMSEKIDGCVGTYRGKFGEGDITTVFYIKNPSDSLKKVLNLEIWECRWIPLQEISECVIARHALVVKDYLQGQRNRKEDW